MTPEEKDKLLAANKARVNKLAKEAYEKLVKRIRNGEAPRDAIDAVMQTFPKKYAKELSASFTAILNQAISSNEVLAMEVSGLKLSQRLYNESRAVSASVVRLVNDHLKGFQDVRALALKIYEGYDFNPKETLSPRAQTLPRYLRRLISTSLLRNDINLAMTRIQAGQLKTPALKASYLELIDKIQAGSGMKALEKKLAVAFHEKMRYFSNRIAQTELHRAWSNQNTQELLADEDVEFVEWRLSGSHSSKCICELFAKQNKYGLGPGVYPKKLAPQPGAHPFCRCMLRPRLDIPLGTKYKEIKGADRAFLNSQDGRDAARIMGSRAKLKSVLDGKDSLEVYNKHIDKFYRVKLAGQEKAAPLKIKKDSAKKPPAQKNDAEAYWNEATDAGAWHAKSFMAAPLFIKRVIQQVGDPSEVRQTKTQKGAYASSSGYIEMGRFDKNMVEGQGVWRHEYGHHVDRAKGKTSGSIFLSSSSEFKYAIDEDAKSIKADALHNMNNLKYQKKKESVTAYYEKSRSDFVDQGSFDEREQWLAARYKAAGFDYAAIKETMKKSAAFPDMLEGISVQDRYREIIDAIDKKDFQKLMDAMTGGGRGAIAKMREGLPTFKKGVLGNLSDLVGSATRNNVAGMRSGFGHVDSYYKKGSHFAYTEVFANLFDYYGSNNQALIKIIEHFMPRTTALFKRSLQDE